MKLALITDTHYGIKQDSPFLLDYFGRFYDEVFFPELKKRKIDTIIHLGDLVDRRKYVNYNTLSRMRHDFLDRLYGYEMHLLAGNHDTYYKDRNDLNALEQLLRQYENIDIYSEPDEFQWGGPLFLFLPWVCAANYEKSLEMINNTKAQVCFAHIAVQGFEMDKGNVSLDGFDRKVFDKFAKVFIGHFHHKSTFENIHYLGAPYDNSWADFDSTKGFHILDTDTLDLEFIKNPLKLFKKIDYDDIHWDVNHINYIDYRDFTGCFLKVIIKSKTNPNLFDMFMENLERENPAEVRVVENASNMDIEVTDDLGDVTDTLGLLQNYCAQLGLEESQKNKLGEVLRSLYNAANEME